VPSLIVVDQINLHMTPCFFCITTFAVLLRVPLLATRRKLKGPVSDPITKMEMLASFLVLIA
jgi:hypothetical protein